LNISICVPTYNRAAHLNNCLQSITANKSRSKADFQICISDNCSSDGTEDVVRRAQASVEIKYRKNSCNLGIPKNFLNAVEMADGEFVWLLGDDDLLLPHALEELHELMHAHPQVDFYYINSFHLTTQYVASFPQPFDTANLPERMTPFSTWPCSGEMKFTDLIDPKISFDFLGGMYLSVFRRRNWIQNVAVLDQAAISDLRTFSHFDNTFPHVKIFSKAFARSRAYFSAKPLSVCLGGARDWTPMFQLVMSVRLIEALDEYKKNGLPYLQYLRCKNYALNNFIPDLVSMFVRRDRSGYGYIKPFRLTLGACLYPNFYLSFVFFVVRKGKSSLSRAWNWLSNGISAAVGRTAGHLRT